MKGWTLANGEEMNKKHPNSFKIPSSVERWNLRPGDQVKCMFKLAPGAIARRVPAELTAFRGARAERMWITVQQRSNDSHYVGALDNDPIVIPTLQHGSRIHFDPWHVIDIVRAS
jgi:hypothetical protein